MISNVVEWLDKTAECFPQKTAVCDEDERLPFFEYQKKALAIARELILTNGAAKRPVAIYLKKSVKTLVSFAAVAYSGNFYSPIDTGMPESRIKKIIDVLQPEVVITSRELQSRFKEFGFSGTYIIYEDINSKETDVDIVKPVQNKVVDTDLLYVLFTSGSTGTPKGVSITHRSVIDYIDWVTDTFGITERDKFGNQAPFYFDNSILDIYCMMKTGATLYIIPNELFSQPVLLLEYLRERKINNIFWVPSAMIIVSKLKAFRNVDLSGILERVLFCGEVMPNKQLNIWRSYLPDCIYANLYGPTEITDACTYYIVDREFSDDESLPIGIPMKNTEILVLDENDKLITEPGQTGELCVRGTSLAVGYYNNPEKTAAAFVQNPLQTAYEEKIYRTGDLVKYNDRHELIYLSRKDFQIKHLGHRIELGEIETAVSSFDEISMCCCLYDEKKRKIVLFLETEIAKSEINQRLRNLVPDYMLPGKVVSVKELPLNANGKIDRVKLKEYLK